MSSEALAWAMACHVRPSSVKFTLIALCECANYRTGRIFPSISHLAEITGQNRKTIINNIATLEAIGLIRDTGERIGATGQIKVYEASLGTVPKTEQSQKRNSSVFTMKESQKRDTEPRREPRSKRDNSAREIPDDWLPTRLDANTKSGAIEAAWPDDQREANIEHFRAHHGKKGDKFKDWQKAWITWVLNSKKFGSNGNGGKFQNGSSHRVDKRSGLARAIDKELERVSALPEMPAAMAGNAGEAGG